MAKQRLAPQNQGEDDTMLTPLVMAALVSAGGHPGFPCYQAQKQPAPIVAPEANHPPVVECIPAETVLMPGEQLSLNARASDPDGDHLTYQWHANNGHVQARANMALFTLNAPVPGFVQVRVSDGRGGTAEAVCHVRPEVPPAVVQEFRCMSGGFPRNLSRLNNVDKACLDDIAVRMRQDPRSRVKITGHADAGEFKPLELGLQRARTAKDYLVMERGIEEARIEVGTAGSEAPLDESSAPTGRARNRRVEILFIP